MSFCNAYGNEKKEKLTSIACNILNLKHTKKVWMDELKQPGYQLRVLMNLLYKKPRILSSLNSLISSCTCLFDP